MKNQVGGQNKLKKISKDTETKIVSIRKQLESTEYSQIGAISIQWGFQQLGEAPPEIWTIKRNKLKRQPEKRKSKNHEYPCGDYLNVQQMDFVGPRYITNYGRIYWLNIIDVDTHCVHVNPVKGKAAENVLPCLIRFWQDFGRPDYLQLDNELSFRGSNRYPHSFGEIIKFSLTQKVTVLFIPPREPWRNGVIEKFNDTFDKKFFRKKIFTDYEDMITKAREFEDLSSRVHSHLLSEFTMNPLTEPCLQISRTRLFSQT
ncbi:MAG: DDE-type integrase/transposase/recombinase, partial [Bacteroidetes bacterium]|nr:DDE-type integrase/transposase/recombinase [Bacteroidota bacterium]